MSKTLRSTMIIAAAVAGIGLILAILGFAFGGMQSVTIGTDGIKISKNESAKTINQSFQNITSIDAKVDLRDVIVKEGKEFRVESNGVGKNFSVEDNNGAIEIKENGHGNGFNFNVFGINLSDKQFEDLIITCPQNQMDRIHIYSDSGDISLENINTKSLDLNTDLGDINLKNIHSTNTKFVLDSGSLNIDNSILTSIDFNLSLGSIDAKNLTASKIDGNLDSGSANIQGTINGPINIKDDLGSIDLILTGKEDSYSYDLETDLGDVNLNGQETDGSLIKEYDNKPKIKLYADSGDVTIKFK